MIWRTLGLLLTVSFCFTDSADDSTSTLQFLFTVFRHGDRTNDVQETYPRDPYMFEPFYPYGRGQLTNNGKMREYKLGKFLYERYSEFLGMYFFSELDAWSTDYNRTKASLELVLAALYPPEKSLNWNDNLYWMPVPFNVFAANDNTVAFPYLYCARHKKLYDSFLESDYASAIANKYKPILNYVQKHTGLEEVNLLELFKLYFTLSTQQENGLVLPKWTKKVFPTVLKNAAIAFYISSTGSTELKKLSEGFLLKRLIDTFAQKINGTINPPDKKILMYSGHEYNVANFLNTLNVFHRHIPSYGSCVMLELHLIDGVYGVKVVYKEGSTLKPTVLNIPQCGSFCPFDRFKKLVGKYIPKSDECNNVDDL